jgi:Domain of unknown function (DUF6285)
MTDRPTALELLEAVTEFLSEEILPTIEAPRLRFRTLVALNALGIAYRELGSAGQGPTDARLRELAERIRAGDVRPDDLRLLKGHVAEKLTISNPAYLDRYREENS